MDNQKTNAVWVCESCVHGPPSSFGGKPCAVCNPHDPLLNCYQKREGPVTTNADRIRAMSDENLAKFIERSDCPPHDGTCDKDNITCSECWLDWLKQEVEQDEP